MIIQYLVSQLLIMKKTALVYGKNNPSKNHFKTKCHNDVFLLACTYMMSQQYIF